jgi:hypothetical protein
MHKPWCPGDPSFPSPAAGAANAAKRVQIINRNVTSLRAGVFLVLLVGDDVALNWPSADFLATVDHGLL